jgi:hypothetical protein
MTRVKVIQVQAWLHAHASATHAQSTPVWVPGTCTYRGADWVLCLPGMHTDRDAVLTWHAHTGLLRLPVAARDLAVDDEVGIPWSP